MKERIALSAPLPNDDDITLVQKGFSGYTALPASAECGVIRTAFNISADALPAVVCAPMPTRYINKTYPDGILYGTDDTLLVIYRAADGVKTQIDIICGGVVKTKTLDTPFTENACAVRFDEYNASQVKLFERLILFPSEIAVKLHTEGDIGIYNLTSGLPRINIASSLHSRLIGLKDEHIYVSGFNNCSNWTLNTDEEKDPNNAWVTVSQSDNGGAPALTAIAAYGDRAVCFRENYMQEIRGSATPFTLSDIGRFGCVRMRAVCNFAGYLAFASRDGVYLYSSGTPKRISEPLGITDFENACLAASGDTLYLALPTESSVFTYSGKTGQWCATGVAGVYSLASNSDGVYALCESGIFRLDGISFDLFDFECELVPPANTRIKSLSVYAEVELGAALEVNLMRDGRLTTIGDSAGRSGKLTLRAAVSVTEKDNATLLFSGNGKVKIYYMKLACVAG